MSAPPQKRSFTSFVRPLVTAPEAPPTSVEQAQTPAAAPPPELPALAPPQPLVDTLSTLSVSAEHSVPPSANRGGEEPVISDEGGRTRIVTASGRVRTYSANRNLPGVTLRLPENRWEALKMLSI